MDLDRNLRFGVLALQADLIDPDRFAEACTAWAAHQDTPLADLLVERGWLASADRVRVETLLDGTVPHPAGPADATTDQVKASVPDTVAPPPGDPVLPIPEFVPRERYTMRSLHATGGIGRVWLAYDDRVGRDVALKELRPDRANHPAASARFLREAQITGQLEHPGIVPIYEVGRRPDGQQPFYTMRFVRGRTLSEAVAIYHKERSQKDSKPLELRELLGAFVGLCNAVAYAHSRGVLHRDLKPQNVVLGDFGEVILLDWGMARVHGRPDAEGDAVAVPAAGKAAETMQGDVMGTPAYMAPEQAEGRLDQLGPGTDVYGLGAILYEILTGRPPFTGEDLASVLRQVLRDPPARPRTLAAGLPAALEAVCLKALAKNPAERYASAKELAGEVQHWLADEPVSAYREPWPTRAGRWMKRHRVLMTAAAAGVLAAVAGLAIVLAVQARANRQLREANDRERQRFDLALEAIGTFHTGVSEDVLLKQRGFEALRTKLLRGAADFYGKLEDLLKGQEDRQSRAALGKAYFQLAHLTDEIGSKEEALAVHRRSLAVRQALAEESAADPAARADVGLSLINVGGLLFDTGKPADAKAAYERARDLYEALADAHPDVARFRSGLANSYNSLGTLEEQTGKPSEALVWYEKAQAIYRQLVDAKPADENDQSELARSHSNVGAMQF